MFRGVNTLNLDSKGRLAIPTKYREALADNGGGRVVLTVDRDHCLLLYPFPEWLEIEQKLSRLSSFNTRTRALQRLLIGHATECELDGSGRILLPPPLREFAALEKTIVMIGQGNKFELWDEQTWNTRRAEWIAAADEGEMPPELASLSL